MEQSSTAKLTRNDIQKNSELSAIQLPDALDSLVLELTPTEHREVLISTDEPKCSPPLEIILRYEEQMLSWLSQSENNVHQYLSEPLITFAQVCDLSEQELKTLSAYVEPQNEQQAKAQAEPISQVLESLPAEAGPETSALSTSTPADLSAGWDFISATQQAVINQHLTTLYNNGVIPSQINRDFNFKQHRITYNCSADIAFGAAPQLGNPYGTSPSLAITMNGDIQVNLRSRPITTVGLVGTAVVAVDINLLEVTAVSTGPTSIQVSMPEPANDQEQLFTEVDLSQLSITLTPGKDPDPDTVAAIILEALNAAVESVQWPQTWAVTTPTPLPPGGLQAHLNYTVTDDESDSNLISLLLSRESVTGNDTLSSNTVPDGTNSTAAFVLSNQAILASEAEVLAQAFGVQTSYFQVAEDYPSQLTSVQEIKGKVVGDTYKVKAGDLTSYINSSNQLYTYAKVTLKGWSTVWIPQHLTYQAWISFSPTSDGELKLNTTYKGTGAWWTFLLPGSIFTVIALLLKGHGDTKSQIKIPGFFVQQVNSPAYLQIGGYWTELLIKPSRPDNNAETLVQALYVNQALNENDGVFEFDFSEYGDRVISYVVGTAYWFLKYGDTDHQTNTIGLSLSDTRINGTSVLVTPIATLQGQGESADTSESSLTLCCLAILNKRNTAITIVNDTRSIDDHATSGTIPVESEEGTLLQSAVLTGWNFSYGIGHHVRSIYMDAELTNVQSDSVEITTNAGMHDDSNDRATSSITGGVIKVASSQNQVLASQVVNNIQLPDTNKLVEFEQKLSAAVVFFLDYYVHYPDHDRDVRLVGGGTPDWQITDDGVLLTTPHAFIADKDGDHHTQDNSVSNVSLLVVGVLDDQ